MLYFIAPMRLLKFLLVYLGAVSYVLAKFFPASNDDPSGHLARCCVRRHFGASVIGGPTEMPCS